MPAAAKAALMLLKDKRVRKAIISVLVCILFLLTAAGTSCTANNLQHYAQETVAADFASLVSDVNDKITDGGQINTELLYAAYITLLDNSQYSDKESVRKKLIACFYTETEKQVQDKDTDGNPKLDANGKATYHTVTEVHAVNDSFSIFSRIEKKFGITIDSEEQEYILNLTQLIANYGSFSPSGTVTAYDALIAQDCAKYGITEYAALVEAVMQQESGGSGNDPMQCSESSLNTKYPREPNGITDPEYSIQVGIEYLASCLRAAKCTSSSDIPGISLALQGYNFGNGYIAWALAKGGYTQANAVEFSQMEAAKLGWSSYGDVNYVSHVLRYYSPTSSSGRNFIYPIQSGKYTISSPFGTRTDPITGKTETHKGIDLAAATGTPIFASAAGTVIYAQYAKYPYDGYGNLVVIQHAASLVSMYGHCSKLLVSVGQAVAQGQIIAAVGSTGEATGPHCHFEIRLNEASVDPNNYLQ